MGVTGNRRHCTLVLHWQQGLSRCVHCDMCWWWWVGAGALTRDTDHAATCVPRLCARERVLKPGRSRLYHCVLHSPTFKIQCAPVTGLTFTSAPHH